MTKIEYLIIKLALRIGRPVTFPEMVQAIGESNYLLLHRSLNHLLEIKFITENTNKEEAWIFEYYPSLEGLEEYEARHEAYREAEFVIPIQRDLFDR